MKRLRIILLIQEVLTPPAYYQDLNDEEFDLVKTEYDVRVELENYGHEVRIVGLSHSLAPLDAALETFEPDIVFNLLEEFQGERTRSHGVTAYLELRGVPYTGCGPRSMALAQDKALSKALLHHHGIPTPAFTVVPAARRPNTRKLRFPLIVKSLRGDASEGLSQASVVRSPDKLARRVGFIHEGWGDALIEEYIPGRELYCGVLGDRKLEALPLWELRMTRLRPEAPNIATQRVKWDLDYQEQIGVEIGRARRLPRGLEDRVAQLSKRAYHLLGMSGWGRIDFRLSAENEPYFLEANPNADIAHVEEFASAAKHAGISYLDLLHRIIATGLRAKR